MTRRGRRKADVPRSRTPLVLALVALLAISVTGAALALWPELADESEPSGSPAPSASPSPSRARQDLDLSNLPVPRRLDCATVDDERVVTALGGPVTDRAVWTSGDSLAIAPGVTDVVHEDGCAFTSAKVEARVWVFTAPVSTADARGLVTEARSVRGCSLPRDATGFGTPDVTTVCPVRPGDRGAGVAATLRGLFGDAWLTCQVTARGGAVEDTVLERADRWCVHVATTLGAAP